MSRNERVEIAAIVRERVNASCILLPTLCTPAAFAIQLETALLFAPFRGGMVPRGQMVARNESATKNSTLTSNS